MKIKLVTTVSFLCISIINNTYSQRWVPMGGGVSGVVYEMDVFNNELYLGGGFSKAGTTQANNIIKWDGNTWTALGSGTDGSVNALAIFQNELYVGGYFETAGGLSALNIAKWTGSNWNTVSYVGTTKNDGVESIALFGNTLYIGGGFYTASGAPTNHIAKWNGTQWGGLTGGEVGIDDWVSVLITHQNNLYVGGWFTKAGGGSGTIVNNIAKYSGSSWSALSSGINSPSSSVSACFSFNNKLYVGGSFTQAGGKNAKNVAVWNGTAWDSLGAGVNGTAWCFTTIDNELYMGGNFSLSGSDTVRNIARWDNGKWVEVAGGTNDAVFCMKVYNDELYIGGNFNRTGDGTDTIDHFAKLCLTPKALFGFSSDVAQNVSFIDSSSGVATSYFWIFGDGQSSSETNPVHHYDTAGKYMVTFIATNICGSDTVLREVEAFFIDGVKENIYSFTSDIVLYQTDYEIIIKSSNLQPYQEFSLFDLSGKKIISGKSEVESFRISKVDLPKGVYMLRVNISSQEGREIKVLIQ